MSTQLIFKSHVLETIEHDGKQWFTAATLASALEYSRGDKITQIYNRNSDEFTPCMSINLKMRFNGINNSLREKDVRIFSLRSAHLVAMFATTPVAKEFRRWVLDIMDREAKKALYRHNLIFSLNSQQKTSSCSATFNSGWKKHNNSVNSYTPS
ncbi:phage antirepressor [Escherichia coli]|nr:hypothetical protein JI426_002655 [Escherichia coli O22:H8]GDJ51138.1 phage antirepressor [Escherichia coli]GDK28543.1 phage antirepressor [Escherichia coli]GDK84878.1 phage antirepressor [Escherichia coli]GDL08919.1 phage antirepressor [Escherichia coli]